jgi:hypothetical protein
MRPVGCGRALEWTPGMAPAPGARWRRGGLPESQPRLSRRRMALETGRLLKRHGEGIRSPACAFAVERARQPGPGVASRAASCIVPAIRALGLERR